MESGILGFGIWNTALGLRNPTKDWNSESKFYRRILESSTWSRESTAWNPESKTVQDSLTWGETYRKLACLLTLDRDFKIQRRGRRRERQKKKTIGLMSKTTTLHVHYTFLYISWAALHDYDVRIPNFAFYGVHKQAKTKFCFSLCTWIWSLLHSTPGGFAYIWKGTCVGRNNCDKDWKNANSLFKRRFRCRRFVGS